MFSRYSRALDTGDYEAYAALFVPDALLGMGQERIQGRDAIREYVKKITEAPDWKGYQHLNTQFLFEEGDANRCSVSCYSTIVRRERPNLKGLLLQGIYRSICVKVDGTWFFEERLWESWNPDKLESYRPSPH
jgi:uncharacterized protein (TIGR02246 family)